MAGNGSAFDRLRNRIYGDGPGGLQIERGLRLTDLYPEEEGFVDEEAPNPTEVSGWEGEGTQKAPTREAASTSPYGEPGQMLEGLREELERRAQEREANTDRFQQQVFHGNRVKNKE